METGMQLADDLLYGVQAIADELGLSRTIAYRLAAAGTIPTFKLAGKIAARRSELREAMSAKSRAA